MCRDLEGRTLEMYTERHVKKKTKRVSGQSCTVNKKQVVCHRRHGMAR